MSVINQMLKDLEQRAPEQGQVPNAVVVNNKPSTVKIIVISVLVLLSLNAIGFYIWDLQTRLTNSEEKAKESEIQQSSSQKQPSEEQYNQKSTIKQEVVKTPNVILAKPERLVQTESPQQPRLERKRISQEGTNQALNHQAVLKPEALNQSVLQPEAEQVAIKSDEQAAQIVTKQVKAEKIPEELIKEPIKQEVTEKAQASKMTVSRRQLTTEELVQNKLASAEKAINTNQITRAEKLFEEVLILQPANKESRKKLAALWFGRKSYQQAINLLSQGIDIDKQDADLRMLKAQIQLKQGQHKGAHRTLIALPRIQQQDYQLMLANVAQQIEAYQDAIMAYKVLITMQPYSGKWHLGLAIVYDRNSQFSLAEKEYALSLSKNDLSSASAEFATQRLQALGE
jgi:MSHA biogenesis protein MshN